MAHDTVVSVLQELGTRARDSEEGYRAAAEDTRDSELQRAFRDLSDERRGFADEIDRLIRQHGGQPTTRGGSLAGAAHRMFMDLRTAMSGSDRNAVLTEVARGEGVAEAAYDSALRAELPSEIKQIVQRQHDRVRSTRDRFRHLSGSEGGSSMGGMAGSIAGAASSMGGRSAEMAGDFVRGQPLLAGLAFFGAGLVAGMMLGGGSGRRSYYRRGSWR